MPDCLSGDRSSILRGTAKYVVGRPMVGQGIVAP